MTTIRLSLSLALAAWIASGAAAAPDIACDRPEYDFGVVKDQAAVTHAFRIRNAGDSDLIIDQVKTSCGCTTARLSSKVVSPNEHVDIDCRFSLEGRRGPQVKNIYVHTNDPDQPIFTLRISGTIRNEVELTPEQVFFSSEEVDWESAVRKAKLSFFSDKEYHVTGMETNAADFCRAALSTVKEGREYEITVALKRIDTIPDGSLMGKIVLLTDHPAKPRVDLNVIVQKRPEIYVVPPQIHLTGTASDRKPVRRYLLVHSRQDNPASVVEVKPPEEDITVRTRLLKPGIYRIELGNLVPRDELDGREIEVRLRKADGAERTLRIPFKITWRPHA